MQGKGINKKKKNYTIVHIFIMALTIIVGAFFIRASILAAQHYYINTHANYVQEYATIVRYEAVHNRYQGYCYTTYYEYQADGKVYSDICQRNIQDEEDAKAQVGKKVVIYVDHTLKRHTDNLNFTSSPIWLAGSFALVCIVVFLNSFIRETIFIVRWTKNKKAINKENENDTKEKDFNNFNIK